MGGDGINMIFFSQIGFSFLCNSEFNVIQIVWTLAQKSILLIKTLEEIVHFMRE